MCQLLYKYLSVYQARRLINVEEWMVRSEKDLVRYIHS